MKILLLISLAAMPLVAKPNPLSISYPKLECGDYVASRVLRKRPNALYVLQLRGGTTSPVEFLLLGAKPQEMFVRNRTHVAVRFFVPTPISDPGTSAVIFDSFVTASHLQKESIERVSKTACGKIP